MFLRPKAMTDDFTTPPEESSTHSKIVDGIKVAGSTVGDAIETGLEPGMPLDIVVEAVRQAPLAALGIAFMPGRRCIRNSSSMISLTAGGTDRRRRGLHNHTGESQTRNQAEYLD